jgi:ubiquinone/menaquinone biosynthesis C-methylase UbiE
VSLRERLYAWWEGEDPTAQHQSDEVSQETAIDQPESDTEAEEDETVDLTPVVPEVVWNAERRALAQIVWGPGYVRPGGLDYIYDLVNGFSLDHTMSMLEVGAGLCAGSRAVVDKFGAYVTALERNADLVAEGKGLNTVHDVEDKVQLEVFNPEEAKFKSRYYVGALMRDVLLYVSNKEDMLTAIIESVKPEGQIMITDFFFDEDDDSAELAAWQAIEAEPVYPWSVGAVKKIFASSNVVMRTAADESDAYRDMVLPTWNDFLAKIQSREVTEDLMGAMLYEAELWARRLAALECGALKYYRILGVKNN